MTIADRSAPVRAGLTAALLASVALLSACADKPISSVPYNVDLGRPDVEAVPIVTADQKIGPADVIDVRVFQVAELSGEHQVDTNGFINMPLIGKVSAQGKSAEELGQHLADRLGQKYLRSPNVNVIVKTAAARTITVDGAVGVAGVFPIQGKTTLLKAVALAKGTTENANLKRVIVLRDVEGKRMAAQFDLQQIRRAEAVDPEVYGNDIVIVDGSSTRSVWRDVLQTLPVFGLLNTFIPR